MKINSKNTVLSLLTISLLIIIYLLKIDKLSWLDDTIYNFISLFICEGLTNFFKFITNFASFTYITILIILIFILVKNKWIGILVAVNSIISTFINKILKSIFVRPRPDVLKLIKQGGYSFPSGHAMASMTFYGILIYLIYKSNISKKLKYTFIIILSILILLIGISRIYLGVHYASDIITGYIVSIIYLIVFITIVNKIKLKK